MEKRPNFIVRLRAWQKPEIRYWLDAFGVFMAITLFFCLLQFAHDGIVSINHQFDSQRWWCQFLSTESCRQERAADE